MNFKYMERKQRIDLIEKGRGLDYEIHKFPDGELHFEMRGNLIHNLPVVIKTRITCADELFILMQVLDVCNRHGICPNVCIYYLMGMRIDRVMDFNRPFTLNIVLKMLDQYDAKFSVLEMHNPNLLPSEKWENVNFKLNLKYCTVCDYGTVLCFSDDRIKDKYLPLYKDAECEFIFFHKERNEYTNELTGVINADFNGVSLKEKRIIVLGDLLEDGEYFYKIAERIKREEPSCHLKLRVAHALQKDGILNVASIYREIDITDSYYDWEKIDWRNYKASDRCSIEVYSAESLIINKR